MKAALVACGGFEDAADAAQRVGQATGEACAAGADLVCLPHLSFLPYFPARRDRRSLELAERPPAASYRAAVEHCGDALLAASFYESEGEGVFYLTAALARQNETLLRYRQVAVEAADGRFEQMYWSPGHDGYAVAETPFGRTALLVGYDLRRHDAYEGLAGKGVELLIGGASEQADVWEATCKVVAGMASLHHFAALVVNRAGREFGEFDYAGGALALDRAGRPLPQDTAGLYDLGEALHG